MIHVIATIQVEPGTRDAFLAEFRKVVPHVRDEAGCLEYAAAIDVATPLSVQDPIRNDVVMVVEKWESIDALLAHLKAPHMADYRERVKEYVDGVRLQVLQPA
jgi:quinol monooxygenase YgiN